MGLSGGNFVGLGCSILGIAVRGYKFGVCV